MIYYTSFNTPIGKIFISKTSKGINLITWQKSEWDGYYQKNKEQLKKDDNKLKSLKDKMKKYFSGEKVIFKEKLDLLTGTMLEKRIWKDMQKIPYGQTRSYKWLASKAGNRKLARAVGGACSRNPIPIIIPCHRVIKSDGGLGGFAGGLDKKKKLLKIEKCGK
ncbi:MAG: methylated-DNA--[protein]-cysteine S-methyltransferase [candidate division Zixibacteria bacterium]|nr:methylated-DNA--[protein]-cysteine S-methyltransferase [candidate division Zixibacteria bacterium]